MKPGGMNLGQSINTYHPEEALHGETGTFRVKVPAGCELTLYRNTNGDTHLRWGTPGGDSPTNPFLITKISEPATTNEGAIPISKSA